MAVSLAHTGFTDGDRSRVVILHGLLGSSRNWNAIGRSLAEHVSVAAVDLRNHGRSPHAPENGYADLVEDVLAWMDAWAAEPVILIGHSLGGKIAMAIACEEPSRVASLVVVDIAPVRYSPRWHEEFEVMMRFAPETLRSRRPVEEALEVVQPDWAFRKFLVSNLIRNEDGTGFRWQVNLPVLSRHLSELLDSPLDDEARYDGPVLVVRGAKSDYVDDFGENALRRYFSRCEITTIPNAGHNVHIDQPEDFLQAVVPVATAF